MAYWLLKTEPEDYAWDDLVRDTKTVWDGVANALALKHLREFKKGDLALIYHTADQRAAVGIAQITSAPYPDPKQGNEKLTVVDLKPKQKLRRPVALAEIKADKTFEGWNLIRIGRLSVVPTPKAMWDRIQQIASAD
jgi:predicted RNA-binding protein with PUA-like domain